MSAYLSSSAQPRTSQRRQGSSPEPSFTPSAMEQQQQIASQPRSASGTSTMPRAHGSRTSNVSRARRPSIVKPTDKYSSQTNKSHRSKRALHTYSSLRSSCWRHSLSGREGIRRKKRSQMSMCDWATSSTWLAVPLIQ